MNNLATITNIISSVKTDILFVSHMDNISFVDILLWGGIIISGFYFLKYLFIVVILLKNYITHCLEKYRYNKRIKNILPKIKVILGELDSIFIPTKFITKDEIKNILLNHNEIINEAKYLSNSKIKSNVKSDLCSLYFKIDEEVLYKRMEENNRINSAIRDLPNLTQAAYSEYELLCENSHYFCYSEMESYRAKLDEINAIKEILIPKYEQYITGEYTQKMFEIANNIEELRKYHNEQFINNELEKNKDYFDKVLGKYPLDSQQRDSIVKLEDNCLVIASAGSGKTSTIVGKAKYLVERQHIEPSRILLLTYTKKAANELAERMNIDGINSGTFHSLAYRIIAEVTGMAPSICENDLPLNVFRNLVLESPTFLKAIDEYILNYQSLMRLEHDYDDAFSYFEDRKKYGIQALFPDVDGNIIFTRSEEEKRLCTMLTRLGVMFRYECPYPIKTGTAEKRQYRPDFTIYTKDENNQWKQIYLEHFAIDRNGKVPRWFGEGTRGGWAAAQNKYIDGIEWKRNTHKLNGTILIETHSADFWDGTVEEKLKTQLINNGVNIKERSDKELYDMLIQRNRQLEKTVFTLLLSFITLMKANEKTIDGLLKDTEPTPGKLQTNNEVRNRFVLMEVVKPFFDAYQEQLDKNFEIDFTDAIIQATKLCNEGLWKPYDYILVDEFQDISIDRYRFLQALRSKQPLTKLYCVGDDWQSIFRFAGSDMSLFYEFEEYFGYTEICKIETTYRFHQPLIDMSSQFILKNKEQRPKSIHTPDGDKKKTYLSFVKCDNEDNTTLKKVEEIVSTIPNDESVIILGRYNYDVMSVGFKGDIRSNDNRLKVKIGGRDIIFLSIHSAKGLEADHVILVNCNQGAYGFPSLIEDDPILDFVLSKSEKYPFAEERRLFYVAMTRAKKKMYILYDKQRPSPFISEFLLKLEIGSYLCPKCLEGKIIPFKDGVSTNGTKYRSFHCSNNEAGCDFFETSFGDLTPPGILITEQMTSQDIEKIREKRRKGIQVYLQQSNSSRVGGSRRYIPNKYFR